MDEINNSTFLPRFHWVICLSSIVLSFKCVYSRAKHKRKTFFNKKAVLITKGKAIQKGRHFTDQTSTEIILKSK